MTQKERHQINRFVTNRFKWHCKYPVEHDPCDSCQAILDGDPDGHNYHCYCYVRPLELEAFTGTMCDLNRAYPHIPSDEFIAIANDRAQVLLPKFDVLYEGEERGSWLVSWQPLTIERQLASRLQRPGLTSALWRILQAVLSSTHHEGALGDFAEDFTAHCQKWGFRLTHLWLLWQIVISIPPLIQVRLEQCWKR